MNTEGMTSESGLEKPTQDLSFLDTLADELAGTVCSVFGAPVERDGVTVIPVAKARWGMGGGFGNHRASTAESRAQGGIGGGGGAMVKPIGFIELAEGKTKFRPIREPSSMAWMAAAAALWSVAVLRVVESLGRQSTGLRPKLARMSRRFPALFR